MVKVRKSPIKKHRPVAILLDKSDSISSLDGELLKGVNRFSNEALEKMKDLILYADITEILAIQFNNEPEVTAEFTRLQDTPARAVTITQTRGGTDTGKALLLALQMLDERKAECKEKQEEYFQPLLFLLTDGIPEPGRNAPDHAVKEYEERYAEAARRIQELEKADKLIFVAGGISVKGVLGADMDKLRELTSKPERVIELDCREGDLEKISSFFEVVLEATNSRPDYTPIDKIVDRVVKGERANEDPI